MVETEKDKNVSLLEENIKTKGENAYYYAHKRIVEDRNNQGQQGKTITGPGIITGGDPVLLDVSSKPVETIKENKKFTKYVFMDDDEQATIKIEFPEELKGSVEIENCSCVFTEKTMDIKVSTPGKDTYYFSVKKLHKKVIPDECKYKLSKDKAKLIVNLMKKDAETEWEKLQD